MPSIKLVVTMRNHARHTRFAPGVRAAMTLVAMSLVLASCAEGIPPGQTPTAAVTHVAETPVPTLEPTPTELPFEPATSLAGAREFLSAGLYREALASFDLVATTETDPALIAEALTGASVAQKGLGLEDESIATLIEAIATAPEGSGTAQRAIYLLGVRYSEREEYDLAAKTLRVLVTEPTGSVLQHYVETQYAYAAAKSGDMDDAIGVWEWLVADDTLPRTLRERIYSDRAELAVAEDDVDEAIDWLSLSADLTGDPQIRYRLALVAKQAGDADTFADTLRDIIRETPASSYALLAIQELEFDGEPVDAGLVGLAYYRHREYASARAILESAVEEPGLTPGDLAFRTYYLAASNEDDGLLAAAVPLYDLAATYDASSQYTHRAHYWAAYATEGLERYQDASDRYLAVASGPSGPFTAESRFRAGYALYLDGQFAAAIEAWDAAPGRSDAKTEYWRARALQASGDEATAVAAFQEAAQLGPRTFYGIQAARALNDTPLEDVSFSGRVEPQPIDWDEVAAWLASETPGDWVDVRATAAIELVSIGLPDAARALLLGIADPSDDPWVLMTVIREAQRAELADVVVQVTFRVLSEVSVSSDDVPDEVAKLLYPLNYVETLDARGAEFNVSPLFLASLIRQESLWNANAVSHAGAMGLTQVIEPTGVAIAQALGVDGFQVSDLFKPTVSVQFGAQYIGAQLDRFNGDPHPALAAYNGGPSNAATWYQIASTPPADFVATVAFSETQRYVELVMQNYAWYRHLYGQD